MEILISCEPEGLSVEDGTTETVKAALGKVGNLYGLGDAEVSVTLTDDEHIRELNLRYRGLDRATDVLSFALSESDEPAFDSDGLPEALGEIVISVERAREQSREYGHSLRREVAFLTVHGMLHLLGYDHVDDDEREEMEREQRVVMEELGIPRE